MRPAARLVEGAAEVTEARGGFVEGGEGAFGFTLGATLDTARFPDRGDPGTAIPHAREALGFVQAAAHLGHFAGLGERDRGRGAKAHRAGLAGADSVQCSVAFGDDLGHFLGRGGALHGQRFQAHVEVWIEPTVERDVDGALHGAVGFVLLTAHELDFRQALQRQSATGDGASFGVKPFGFDQEPLRFVHIAGEQRGLAEAREGERAARIGASTLRLREQLGRGDADLLVTARSAQTKLRQAKVPVEHAPDELRRGANPFGELGAKKLEPAPLHVRGQAQQRARFTDLARELAVQRERPRFPRNLRGFR
jgi:hypothetical protein